MNNFIKKNINIIIGLFIIMQPIIDLLTGLSLHYFNINLTIGIVLKILFLLIIMLITIFTYNKKKIIIPYSIILLYTILYIIGIVVYKDGVGMFREIQNLIKVFYFPTMFLALYYIRDEFRISKMVLFTTLFLYLIFIFVPLVLGIGYKSYQITKAGTLGFYNSANEISGIISILTPIVFIIFSSSKKYIPKLLLIIMYLVVILMIGTKTPLLTLIITIGLTLVYYLVSCFKNKKYKNILIALLITIICSIPLVIVIPETNFYKNIRTHLKYLKADDDPTEILEDEKLIDHFIFSQRITFLSKKAKLYKDSSTYQKLFGIGYLKNNKNTKLIEMDYFDIFYSHGIIGFIVFFSIYLVLLFKIVAREQKLTYERFMLHTSLILILFLSLFTGHIITAPSVSLIVIIIILYLAERAKRDLLFTSFNMGIGGIENALVNLLNRINYNKYNVCLVLEEKDGELLDKVNNKVNIKEVRVSSNNNIIVRKVINAYRKLIFKIFNYNNYDFSCCYATYSYSGNKLAKMSSMNNSIYIHSDYSLLYNNLEYIEFFNSRGISEFKRIIFVSNEARDSFLKYYADLEEKTLVLNNFVDINDITNKSKESISDKKSKDILFVFVGRLDDTSKKLKRALNLVKEIKTSELWIVGDGPDYKLYEKYVEDNNLKSRVKFMGMKKNPYPYMMEADYIILTSDYEGFPVVYLEALVLNKRIITTINTSDDSINMEDYAYIISRDEDEMINEVKDIIKNNKHKKSIDLDKIYKTRMKRFEEIFNDN